MRRTISVAVAGLLAGAGGPALAAETIAYSYDARGRLIEVARSGTVNNGITSRYRFDKADNRIAVTVSGSCLIKIPIGSVTHMVIPKCRVS